MIRGRKVDQVKRLGLFVGVSEGRAIWCVFVCVVGCGFEDVRMG